MISVCMATYNGEKYIKEQVDSILSQLSSEDELIVSDDGSKDKTLEILNAYNDNRIKIYNHISNKSFSNHEKATSNFENALSKSSGNYIFLCDQDDIWRSDKVEKCIEQLQKNDFVVHDMKIIDVNGKVLRDKRYTQNPLPSSWISIILQMKLWGCCMCFTRKVLNKTLPFPHKLIGHDYWIAAIALKHFNCNYINQSLIFYREHKDSVSYKKKTSILYKLRYRVKLFNQLIFK